MRGVILLCLAILICSLHVSSKTNVDVSTENQISPATVLNPYSGTGDWTISTSEVISDLTIHISGNILVNSPGIVIISDSVISLEGTITITTPNHVLNNVSVSSSNAADLVKISNSDNVTVKNSNIIGGGSNSIKLMNSNDVKIVNNSILANLGPGSAGIRVTDSSNSFFENNTIYIQSYGVFLDGSNTPSNYNTIEDNVFYLDPADGFGDRATIVLGRANFNIISNNRLVHLVSNENTIGIEVKGSSNNLISNNYLANQSTGYISSAYSLPSTNNLFEQNIFGSGFNIINDATHANNYFENNLFNVDNYVGGNVPFHFNLRNRFLI